MSTQPPAKVLMLIPHLGGGGAEHVIATLARNFDPTRYEVHLGVVTSQPGAPINALSSGFTVHQLRAKRVRTSGFKLLRLIWALRPSLIIAGMAHLNALVLMLKPLLPPRTCFIVRQNGSARAMVSASRLPLVRRLLFLISYRRAHRIICQTNEMALELQQYLNLDPRNISVLANPVDLRSIRRSARRSKRHWTGAGPNLLAVSRLSYEKGVDLLLDAFAHIHETFPRAELVIAGSGPEEAELKRQSINLGLAHSVHFVGHLICPAMYFAGASAFVVPSRDEGLPNALLEAAAGGLPIIALPSSPGMANLLQGKEGVWLAAGVSATALQKALVDALSFLGPTQRFPHAWIKPFDLPNAVAAYESILDRSVCCEDK